MFGSCGKGHRRCITWVRGEIQGEADFSQENILNGTLLAIEVSSERGEKGEWVKAGSAYLKYMPVPIRGCISSRSSPRKARARNRLPLHAELKPHMLKGDTVTPGGGEPQVTGAAFLPSLWHELWNYKIGSVLENNYVSCSSLLDADFFSLRQGLTLEGKLFPCCWLWMCWGRK